MNEDFVICARSVEGKGFGSEPGSSLFLLVPPTELPCPPQAQPATSWVKKLRKQAIWGRDSRVPAKERGDILVFIHGYNNSQEIVMKRHRRLSTDLREAGFRGAIVSFDWPSSDMALNYLEDRHDAKKTALQLVTDCIRLLAAEQGPDCTINVHLLGHSTGVYVIREAFDDADDAALQQSGWMVSQIAFIGGDISAASLSQSNPSSEAIYRHCVRLTNYSNECDSVLKLSNTKRAGMSPRVGRVGLPADAPAAAVNVDCTDYFHLLENDPSVRQQDQTEEIGTFCHSWHIGNRRFARDLFETLRGDLSRNAIPTREMDGSGKLKFACLPQTSAGKP